MRSVLLRRDVAAWCLYDWANSAFVTSVTVVLLPVYYASEALFADPERVRVLGFTTNGDSLWAYLNSLYMIVLALVAPVIGAMADSSRGKKRYLATAALVGGAATIGLGLTGSGDWVAVSVLYLVAAVLWGAGNIFYDGFLPELTDDPGEMDTISGAGYGIGYLGGGLMLLLNLVLVNSAGEEKAAATRLSFVLVGAWWILFTVPLLLLVRERGAPAAGAAARAERPGRGVVREGFARLRRTLGKIRSLPHLGRFLLAFLLYNSGVGTIMIVAANYAASELALGLDTIVGCLLMIQFVGLPAAFGYVWLARRIGTRASIFAGIGVYAGVVIYAMQIGSAAEFWVLGFLLALVQGGTQAMSRSLYGTMVPEGMSAEFFGFFSIFNKVGTFAGPLAFGVVRDLTGSSRAAILFLVVFFVLGFLVLLGVRPERGREEARAFAAADAGAGG